MTSTDPTPDSQLTPYTGRWTLDPARSSFTFRTKAMWVLPVKGTVSARSGGGVVGEDGRVEGELILDATTLATGMKKRDAHLQTDEFFDTANHPTFDFRLTSAQVLSAGRAHIDGELTVAGQTAPISFDAAAEIAGATATLSGSIDDLDRRRWGVSWAKMGAGVHNQVDFKAVFTRA